jgi:hypothetical protein
MKKAGYPANGVNPEIGERHFLYSGKRKEKHFLKCVKEDYTARSCTDHNDLQLNKSAYRFMLNLFERHRLYTTDWINGCRS